MAKPIKSTPELTGDEANKFLERMIKVENSKITAKQRCLREEMEQNMKELVIA